MTTRPPTPRASTANLAVHEMTTVADFRSNGVAIAAWAESNGFSPALVYAVLRGERKCLRGQSHQIAKALGMK